MPLATLLATACPAPQLPITLRTLAAAFNVDPVTANGEQPMAGKWLGTAAGFGANVNYDIRMEELGIRYGGGLLYAVGMGLTLTVPGSGLTVPVAPGHVVMNGVVEPLAASVGVTSATGRHFIWVGQNGTIHAVPPTATFPLAPPDSSQDYCLIGSAVVSGGNVTSVDYSGVIYAGNGSRVRYTSDAGAPGDTPAALAQGLTGITPGGSYEWLVNAAGTGTWEVLGVGQVVGNATSTTDGLVKTNTTVADPVVYRKQEVDSGFIATGAAVAGILTGTVLTPTGLVAGTVTDTESSLSWKPAARLLATTNLTLTGAATIDGSAVVTGDVVLATGQTTGSQDGPWVANTAGAWTRPTWWPAGGTTQAFAGTIFLVTDGAVHKGQLWELATTGAITIGTTAVTFSQVKQAAQGDCTGTLDALTVSKIDGVPVDNHTTPPTTGQFLAYNGTAWAPATDADTGYGYGSSEELVAAELPASTVSATTTETAFSGAVPIPANSLAVGDAIRVTARGHYSEDADLATYALKLKLGTVVLDQQQGGGSAVTDASGWWYRYDGVVSAIGASGSIGGAGDSAFAGVPGLHTGASFTTATVDTTATENVSLTVTPSHGSANDTITLDLITVEVL